MTTTNTSSRAVVTVLLSLLLATFEGVDLQTAGLAVPQIRAEFGLSAHLLGYFTAASSVGFLVGSLGGGRIADFAGRRRSLVAAILLFGLFSVVTAFSTSFDMLAISRFITGIGLGGALPNLVALVSENTPLRWRSRSVAVMYAGFPSGGALASALMAWIANKGAGANWLLAAVGLHPGDWRLIFYFGGAAPLIAVPVILLFLPDSEEFAKIKDRASVEQSKHHAGWFGAVLGSGQALNSVLLWISFFTTLLILYLLLNWLPTLLNSRGFVRSDAFWVQFIFNAGGIPGSVIAGMMMDSANRRLTVPAVYSAIVVFLVLMAISPANISIALLLGGILGGAVMASQALLYGLAPSCYPTATRGTGVGTAVCIGRIGSVVGPLLAATLIGSGQSASQVLMAIVPLAVIGGLTAIGLTGRLKVGIKSDTAAPA